ncbi:MAG: hypothetical protein WD069_12620 [Planctomycetales bacterium]
MAKSNSLPDHVLRVCTYTELRQYALAFADACLNLLLLFGAAGLGKSRCLREAVGEQVSWIDGNGTPFGIYMEAYKHRDQPLVLDDVDGLHRDHRGVRLLKTLCQSEPSKRLCWMTAAAELEKRGIPRQFDTTSRVAIIANRWETLNADVAALQDRGHVLHFEPSAGEVHRHCAEWFWNQEIFDFVGRHLHLMASPSLRTYGLAWELMHAGLPWRPSVLSRCLTGPALEVAKLKADPSFEAEEARVRAFVEAGHGCRATYFNHARKLQPPADIPAIKLLHTKPPEPAPQSPLDLLTLLRQRHGDLGAG